MGGGGGGGIGEWQSRRGTANGMEHGDFREGQGRAIREGRGRVGEGRGRVGEGRGRVGEERVRVREKQQKRSACCAEQRGDNCMQAYRRERTLA